MVWGLISPGKDKQDRNRGVGWVVNTEKTVEVGRPEQETWTGNTKSFAALTRASSVASQS